MNPVHLVPMVPLLSRSCGLLLAGLFFLVQSNRLQSAERDPLNPLIELLHQIEDSRARQDILQGIVDGLDGAAHREMPPAWTSIESSLLQSKSEAVRLLALRLSLKFGRAAARQELEKMVQDPQTPIGSREAALNTLIASPADSLPQLLLKLLNDKALTSLAIRGLASSDRSEIAPALIARYPTLRLTEKQEALNTLASRSAFAIALLKAVGESIPKRDLTPSTLQQLQNLQNPSVNELLETVWGAFREPTEDAAKAIRRYRKVYRDGGSPAGNASRGRSVFIRTCQQCHKLHGLGGDVGPDLTGSNRTDLTYLLQNVLDPSAVIPNDYVSSVVETRDDRVITGITTAGTGPITRITTPTEILSIPTQDILDIQTSTLSLMPEGLLSNLEPQEARDLLFYLMQPGQAPLEPHADHLEFFFDGKTLATWDGDPSLWRLDNGVLVGHSADGLLHNEFLVSQMPLTDFRLIIDVKLTPNSENSGIQFRSQRQANGEVKGYQADIGAGWWGKLYEELGRGLLASDPKDQHVKSDDWNRYEVLARGHRIQTALNGNRCVDLTDPAGALEGHIAFQLHSGGPLTVAFRNVQLELSPSTDVLKTVNN